MLDRYDGSWVFDLDEVRSFAAALINARDLDTPVDVLDYFTTPYLWSREHSAWVIYDRPADEEDEMWEHFCRLAEFNYTKHLRHDFAYNISVFGFDR